MKQKHLAIRVEQCLALSKASNCPRRKFGALLLDPERNVILMDGYNGGPRGGGELCAGSFCARDGLTPNDIMVRWDQKRTPIGLHPSLADPSKLVERFSVETTYHLTVRGTDLPRTGTQEEMETRRQALLAEYKPIKSGTRIEVGCHHAEMNVICNAAASGVATQSAWLIVTGEPCVMCAKLIHHAGITRVIVVEGGYSGRNGLGYLRQHGVEVEKTTGPRDSRGTNDSETS